MAVDRVPDGPSPPFGIVLAGGRSSRFGRDKLAELIDGEPLLWRPIRALADAGCVEVVLVLTPGGEAPTLPFDIVSLVHRVRDGEAFGGPLSGLRSGLGFVTMAAGDATVLVVGGDQPSLAPAVLRDLADRIEIGRLAVTLADRTGRMRPLPMAVAARPALSAATGLLGEGERRLRVLATTLAADVVPFDEWIVHDPAAATLADIDLPSDLPDGSSDRIPPPPT